MTPALWTLAWAGAMYALGTLAYLCARRSSYYKGKAEVYDEIATAWRLLSDVTWMRDKQRQKVERTRGFLMLALCDPKVCDALEEALVEARRHWKHEAAA